MSNLLHRASANGNVAEVRRLLDEGANVNAFVGRFQPIHVAVDYSRPKVIELLLERGANPNTPDREGYAPLHLIANSIHVKNRAEMAEILIAAGADVNLRSGTLHYTPMQQAAFRLDKLEYQAGDGKLEDMQNFMQILWDYGATLDAPPGYRVIGESGGRNSRVRAAFIKKLADSPQIPAKKVKDAAKGLANIASATGFPPEINAQIMKYIKRPNENPTDEDIARKREAYRKMTESQGKAYEAKRAEERPKEDAQETEALAAMKAGRKKTARKTRRHRRSTRKSSRK